jgi:hypothetical protein
MTPLTLPLQAKSCGMRFYVVTFGPRAKPRLSYVVMARTSSEAWDKEVCMREPGERMEVLPADSEPFPVMVARNEWECKELEAVAADLRYLATQAVREKQRLQETQALERTFSDRMGWLL